MLLQRKIVVTFQLDVGTFDDPQKSNTLRVEGLRVRVGITAAGGPSLGQATIRIYGMRLNDMAQIMKPFRMVNGQINYKNNRVIVEAGDEVNGMSRIFAGNITQAPIDLSNLPETCLLVLANAGAWDAVKTIPPTSYPGSADVAVIMQNLANTRPSMFDVVGGSEVEHLAGFENNGVSVILSTQYLKGTLIEQATAAATAAHINWVIDEKTNVLAIWPKGGSRGGVIPEISPESGMIGYPVNMNNLGISVGMIFNPQLQLGGQVQIRSGMPYATGKYRITSVAHDLDSEMANGQWESKIEGWPLSE